MSRLVNMTVTDVLNHGCAIVTQQEGWRHLAAYLDRCLISQFNAAAHVNESSTTDISDISALCQQYLHPVHFSHTFLPQLRSQTGSEIDRAPFLSHFGGDVPYISEDGAWPTCPNIQRHRYRSAPSQSNQKFDIKSKCGIAQMTFFFQLRICDFPPSLYGVMCPRGMHGKDLFQFFMCPYCFLSSNEKVYDHGGDYRYNTGDHNRPWMCRWQRVTETVQTPAVFVDEVSDDCEVLHISNRFDRSNDHEASVPAIRFSETSNPDTRSLSLLSHWIRTADLPTIHEDWQPADSLSSELASSLWDTRWHRLRTAHHHSEKLSGWPTYIQNAHQCEMTCPECQMPMQFFFQICSRSMFRYMIGDNGLLWIWQCQQHRHQFKVSWETH